MYLEQEYKKNLTFKNELLDIIAKSDDVGYTVLKLMDFFIDKGLYSSEYEEMTSLEQEEIQDVLEKAKDFLVLTV